MSARMTRAILLVLAGCGRIGFGAPATIDGESGAAEAGVHDASAEMSSDGASMVGCIDPGDGDPFTSGTPCSKWGSMVMLQTALTESSGALLAVPTPTVADAHGGCTRTAVPFTAAGVFVEISRPLTNGDTELSAGGFAMSIRSGQMLALVEPGESTSPTVPYDPFAMRWLRLRPSNGRVAFEYSPNGTAWTIARTSTTPAPADADVTVGARTPNVEVMPGVAQIEGINVCPP
jgi:hypothetical protein